MTGVPRARLTKAVADSFPYLPSGCTVQLDRVARDEILRSLRQTVASARTMVPELRELAAEQSGALSMREYLNATGRDLEDIYAAGGWTTLKRRARLADGDDAETEDLSRRLGWLLHIDEPARLRAQGLAIFHLEDGQGEAPLSPTDRRRIEMLDAQLWPRGEVRSVEETIRAMTDRPAIAAEVGELQEVLGERIAVSTAIYPVPEWPLCLHHHYSRREIVAAVGFVEQGEKKKSLQGGILTLKDRPCELLFVTLDKTGAGFSPTTRYRDYAISRELFHWETQGVASVSRPSGRRYIESPGNGMTFQLFVRLGPDDAFAYLGPAVYLRHDGDRPIAITWKLETPMPGGLFERYATLAT